MRGGRKKKRVAFITFTNRSHTLTSVSNASELKGVGHVRSRGIGVARLLETALCRVRMHYRTWSAGQLAARAVFDQSDSRRRRVRFMSGDPLILFLVLVPPTSAPKTHPA